MTHALVLDPDATAAEALARELVAAGVSVACVRTLDEARRRLAMQPAQWLFVDAALEAEAALLATAAPAGPGTDPGDARRASWEEGWRETGRWGPWLWGRSPAMRALQHRLGRVAATSVTVLLVGESGTGKDLVARSLHALGRRSEGPLVALNCAAVSPTLAESELFGHERGSFTGAERQHPGHFERAHGGTLFLDEVTEMPAALQVKLLRVLEDGEVLRLGATRPVACDVRIVAATNRDPLRAVEEGRLREDLFHRLNAFPLRLPPLRERREDVPLLATQFLQEIGEREGRPRHFDAAALAQLQARAWPGNVRELRHAVQRAWVMADGDEVGVAALDE
ncbi:sigma-54 dependent transcriptional regulator [Piscinibacter sakaiensis]|uniref:sigma 54-interacting transcriptional regulator n=1 Tax=Piscinibacter sakaiensis TaxID=1547922 RepID=UPI00372CA02D